MSQLVFLSGLPRSFSTGMANILAMHPNIEATPTSPLCEIVQSMIGTWSKNPSLTSQLDHDFNGVYSRLHRSILAFIYEYSRSSKGVMIDKGRAWLGIVSLLQEIIPDFKMIVTLRDLRSVFASIEKAHRKSQLLGFSNDLDPHIAVNRMNQLFDERGIIGGPLRWLNNILDVPGVVHHLYILRYEDFLSKPKIVLPELFQWLGVPKADIDLDHIVQSTHESDSHYNMKYRHVVREKLDRPEEVTVSPRILTEIVRRNAWFYELYYPDLKTTS
jgi:sulfotransferase